VGVVNVTPDSFSDGGKFVGPGALEAAVAHAEALVAAGADVLDVGGEATNPWASPVDAAEERRRILPVIEALALRVQRPISVDTTKAEVARAAVEAGAEIINDVSGGRFDPAMRGAIGDAAYVLGHLRGESLREVFAAERPVSLADVVSELTDVLATLPAAVRDRTIVDPGLGFGKGADPSGNVSLLAHAGSIGAALGCPTMVGPSRKRFLGKLIGSDREADLDAATVGACLAAVAGGANLLRVHNVSLLRPALVAYWSTRVVT
jgi:dihydropteroate synthase